jgi:hypothetical protein
LPGWTPTQVRQVAEQLREDGASEATVARVLSDPRMAEQVVVGFDRRTRSVPVRQTADTRKFCIQLHAYYNSFVAENVFGMDLWTMTLRTTACRTAGFELIRSRTYRRSFSNTSLGSTWQLEKWTKKINKLKRCGKISGVVWCKDFHAFASAHVKSGIGDVSVHKYPWAETKYGPDSFWHDNGV